MPFDIERVHFCGLSKGGMVGQVLGARHGDRLISLALCSTSCHMPAPEMWEERIRVASKQGMAALADGVIERWLTEPFRREPSIAVDRVRQMILDTPAHGYAGRCAAIRDMDLRELIGGIRVPTLVIVGEKDPATPPRWRRRSKPHPRCQARGGAGCRTSAQHRAGRGVRCCPHVAARPASRLSRGGRPMSKDFRSGPRHSKGGPRRRARRAFARQRRRLQPALSGADHRVLLGAVWGRPGLSRKTRSLLNLAMLTALNREEEFKLHVRAAFRNGVTRKKSARSCSRARSIAAYPPPTRPSGRREVFAQMAREEAVANNLAAELGAVLPS